MEFKKFRVFNYRNVIDSGWIEVNRITAFVGPNECGKSNLFDALYRVNPYVAEDKYDIDEDWPVDKWGDQDEEAIVCKVVFVINDQNEIADLFNYLEPHDGTDVSEEGEDEEGGNSDDEAGETRGEEVSVARPIALPKELELTASRKYVGVTEFSLSGEDASTYDPQVLREWAERNIPKFVSISEYELPGTQTELPELVERRKQRGWARLSAEDQAIFVVLDLARVDIDDFIEKGETPKGRTLRTFDKVQASAYLTKQFARLWRQKNVSFDIEIDATTLNIFVKDEGIGMPVRLSRRSTGFRWHVSFAWKFTHASRGEYKNCILLLEEPGIHLHHEGQRDLLVVLEELSKSNTILYTTHLPTMLDPGYPEQIRIVEVHDYHTKVVQGLVSGQKQPMAVIEARLGLAGNMGGLLGNRQTLIVEGGDDALILQKLSGVLNNSGGKGLSDRIYIWPAEGASKTPMYAGFMVGQKWDAGVLLDSDEAGEAARKKITSLYLNELADDTRFRVFMLKKTAGIKKDEAAIEDLFPEDFYIDCVNKAYGIAISDSDLPVDGSTLITKRVEKVLQGRHGRKELDKRLVMGEMLSRFDEWKDADDLPPGTAEQAEKLFEKINEAFA